MLGTGRLPSVDDIEPAIRLGRDVTLALAGGLLAGSAVAWLRDRR